MAGFGVLVLSHQEDMKPPQCLLNTTYAVKKSLAAFEMFSKYFIKRAVQ
jgi:hypothetical protein